MTDKFIDTQSSKALDDLKEFLRIPSISTVPDHDSDCRAAADWLSAHFRALGCPKVESLGSNTHPVVVAQGPAAPGRPTVLVYGHYDVQPADPLDEWETPPFEPTERNGNLYARGATDDKGQIFAVIKAFEAVSGDGGPPVNVRFLIEGQEESGGGVIEKVLSENPDLVKADAVLVSDMPYYAPGWPAIYTALRGLYYCEITVRTLRADLHSGMYGGVAPNAHETLLRMLAQLKGKSGRIRIPELYDTVEPPSKTERKAWRRLPFRERKFMRDELGAKAIIGLKKGSPLERLWALPTFEIHGITGGYTGAGAKTVIPAVATAKVSLRLVPNQRFKTVGRQLKKVLRDLAPAYADVSIRFIHGADPIQTDPDSRPVALMGEAFEEVEGRAAVPIRSGGSIPIVGALGRKKAPVVLAGLGLPDDGLHAPNEKIALEQFWTGIRVFGRFFEKMGAV